MAKKKTHFDCCYCNESIAYEDVGGNPYKDGGKPLCDDCYRRNFMIQCPLCEEDFPNKTPNPDKYYFVIMPADVKQTGMKSGIYRGKKYPIWTSDMFSVTIDEFNVELVKPLNKHILHQDDHTNQICPDCFKRYTNEDWLKVKKKILLIDALMKEMRHRFYKVIRKHKGDLKYFSKVFKPTHETLNRRSQILYHQLRRIEL